MKSMLREGVALMAAAALAVPVAALGASKKAASAGTGASSAASTAPDEKLVEGLEKLHAGNQSEIQSGKLAQQSATNAEVKSFAEKMVSDHTRNDEQLTSLAQTMGVSLQGKEFTKEQQDAQKRMRSVERKKGADFDKAYINAMVKDHEKDTKDVQKLAEQARKDGQDDLASFLTKTEETMQGHLSLAKQLKETVKNEKNTASRKSSSASGTGSSASPQ